MYDINEKIIFTLCENCKEKIKNNNQIFYNYGWICPKCGAVLSPYTTSCTCSPINMQITCNF